MDTDLTRFHRACGRDGAHFDAAVSEVRAGRKTGHWMWWVFPQLSGLGVSEMSRTYAIDGVGEAIEYIKDPVLLDRLVKIAVEVRHQLTRGVSIVSLMGSAIDATKLVSSLTLFGGASRMVAMSETSTPVAALASAAAEILQMARAQGFPACEYTRSALAAWTG